MSAHRPPAGSPVLPRGREDFDRGNLPTRWEFSRDDAFTCGGRISEDELETPEA